ncbi:hypothetical protein BG000_001200 [Podila horticola]|nr:hypothetical protein BG000_001200 [Podila horticola]
MHTRITTILVTACSLLGLSHSSPEPPLPLPFSLSINIHNHKPHTLPDPLSTDNSETYIPPYPNPGILAPLPPWFKWPLPDTLAVTPRFKPIYTTDELVDFIVDVPKDSLQTVVTLNFGGAGRKLFKASVHPGVNIISVPKSNIATTSTTVTAILGPVQAKATFAVYKEPAPGISHIVRVDHLHGSLVPQHHQVPGPFTSEPPLFPFGMYAGFSNFGEKDPVGAMKELKEMGINHVNFVPPYEDGKQIEACIKAAQDVGVSIQYDMRHTYVNTTSITVEVNSVKAYSSLATWYTADEPDGQSTAPEPQASDTAYRTIQSIDPHRPVMLVLNYIRDSVVRFAHAADIIMTDVYPVGLDPAECDYSPEGTCCGCSGCFGDLGTDIRRRMQSYRSQLAKIGKPRMPIWMVLQAFSDPNTCWSRAPTPEEYRLMAYLSLIYGAKGLMGWIYPQGLTPSLKASIPGLSAELVPFASRFILGGDQVLELTDTKRQISAGSWTVDGAHAYVVANSGDKAVTLTDTEVATIFGQNAALVEGRRSLESLAVLILTTA